MIRAKSLWERYRSSDSIKRHLADALCWGVTAALLFIAVMTIFV